MTVKNRSGMARPVFHRPSLARPAGNWSLWATIWWTGKRRANTCSSGPVRWHRQGIPWIQVETLTLSRDAVRVTPTRPQFGFDEYEPDTFMDDMQVEHRTSALLVFTLEASPGTRRAWKPFISQKLK